MNAWGAAGWDFAGGVWRLGKRVDYVGAGTSRRAQTFVQSCRTMTEDPCEGRVEPFGAKLGTMVY